jgi:hypothetical protein
LASGCAAFIRTGRLNRLLHVTSIPAVPEDSPFWPGLLEFGRRQGLTQLELESYASDPGAAFPAGMRRCATRARCEYVLELTADIARGMGENHRRNLRKGGRRGLVIRRTRDEGAAESHHALMRESLDRRRARGEPVQAPDDAHAHHAYLNAGVGELFQAVDHDTVLSSVLVMLAPRGGYYQSAGTSADGMASGASHFLIHGIANLLRQDGRELLNLGGADEGSGLAQFKSGFGASPVPLTAAWCDVGAPWRRWAGALIARVRARG